MSTNFYDRQLLRPVIKKTHFLSDLAHLSEVFHYPRTFISEIFERNKFLFKEDFWVFYNDSLGINYVDSYDGCLQFWTKSWSTCEKCDLRNVTSVTDRIEKIFQVVNEGVRSFDEFMIGRVQFEWTRLWIFLDFWRDCGLESLDYWKFFGLLLFYWYLLYINGWFLFRNYSKYYVRWTRDLSFVLLGKFVEISAYPNVANEFARILASQIVFSGVQFWQKEKEMN